MTYKNFKSSLVVSSLVVASAVFLGAQDDRPTVTDLGDYRIDRSVKDEAFELAKAGNSEAAIEKLESAIPNKDDSIAWHYRHASLLLKLAIRQNQAYGQYAAGDQTALQALDAYQDVLRRLGDDGDTVIRSICYNKVALIQDIFVGNRLLAIENYRNALAISSEDENAIRNLRRLHVNEF